MKKTLESLGGAAAVKGAEENQGEARANGATAKDEEELERTIQLLREVKEGS